MGILIKPNLGPGDPAFIDAARSKPAGGAPAAPVDLSSLVGQAFDGSFWALYNGSANALFSPASGSLTAEFFINCQSNSQGNTAGMGTRDLSGSGWFIGFLSDTVYFDQAPLSGSETYKPLAISEDSAWHHVAIVWNGSSVAVAVDGSWSDSASLDSLASANRGFSVGNMIDGNFNFFIGSIAGIRVSATQRYTIGTGFTAPSSYTPDSYDIAIWPLNGDWADCSGNGRDLSVVTVP